MTEWEDCKHDVFFTLNLTENDNCKHYNEYEYDRKRLLCTVNHRSFFRKILMQYCLLINKAKHEQAWPSMSKMPDYGPQLRKNLTSCLFRNKHFLQKLCLTFLMFSCHSLLQILRLINQSSSFLRWMSIGKDCSVIFTRSISKFKKSWKNLNLTLRIHLYFLVI